jgi:hypothetical protein
MANTATFRAHYEGCEYHRIIEPLSICVMAKVGGGATWEQLRYLACTHQSHYLLI